MTRGATTIWSPTPTGDHKTELDEIRRRLAADGFRLLQAAEGFEIQHTRYDSLRSDRLTLEEVKLFTGK